jgi:hypothetical protein
MHSNVMESIASTTSFHQQNLVTGNRYSIRSDEELLVRWSIRGPPGDQVHNIPPIHQGGQL